jgi:hypothetical protein
VNNTGLASAFVQEGTWEVGLAGIPQGVSLSPLSGSGTSAIYTGVFNHTGAPTAPFASNHYLAYMLLLPTPNVVNYTAQGSCMMEYNVIAKGMRLVNNAGTDWLGGPPNSGGASSIPLTTGGTISNSVCTVNVGASSAVLKGDLLTVNYSVTFNSGFTGRLATFLQELDVNGNWAGVTQLGNWTALAGTTRVGGPNATPVTSASGAESSATFTMTFSHSSSLSSIYFATMLVSAGVRSIKNLPNTVPHSRLMISETFNVAEVLPDETREAIGVSETFRLFYVLENYLREFILNVLSEADKENWWNSVPKDVQTEVARSEDTEESKRWMNLNPRG